MRSNKMIIITLLIVIFVVAITMGLLYLKTDFLKSDEQLFYKYLAKTQILDDEVSTRYEEMFRNMQSSNYVSKGILNCSTSTNDITTNIANIQNLFSIKYNILENKNSKQSYADFTMNINKQDKFTVKYLEDNNIYALKDDNIVKRYVAIENSNLKTFFTRLGIEDVSKIPDSVPQVTWQELIKIDENLLKDIKMTYGKIIKEKLESDNFTKITNSNKTITIELSLTEEEVSNIIKAILEKLKNDENTLDLIINKANLLGYELNIDSFRTTIQEKIDKITNTTYYEEEFIKLAITEDGKNTTKINFKAIAYDTNKGDATKIKSQFVFEIDLSESNKVTIYVKDGTGNNIREDITFGYEENSISTNVEIFDLDGQGNVRKNVARIQYQINNYESRNITQNMVVTLLEKDNNTKIQFNIDNKTQLKQDIQIEKITNENAEILNNKTSQELNNLINSIIARVKYLYENEINVLTNII